MRLPEMVRRTILAVLPWYNATEVEARHARTLRVLSEARDVRAAYARIARRLDGR